jgi:hypothetical protein
MTSILSSSTSQISPAMERVYHQSRLVGDWKGVWTKTRQQVEFKVLNIRGTQAQVEYTHNGHTERGLGDVNGATISFGNVSIGTRDGQTAAFEFSSDTAKQTAVLAKVPSTDQQNQLVGTWSGFSRANGQSVTFVVTSIDGRDAQVKLVANGSAMQTGTATVSKNAVMFAGKAQFTSNDGETGNVVVQIGRKSYAVPVTKAKPAATSTSSSSVNKLA